MPEGPSYPWDSCAQSPAARKRRLWMAAAAGTMRLKRAFWTHGGASYPRVCRPVGWCGGSPEPSDDLKAVLYYNL